jgi:hypothetical protein
MAAWFQRRQRPAAKRQFAGKAARLATAHGTALWSPGTADAWPDPVNSTG